MTETWYTNAVPRTPATCRRSPRRWTMPSWTAPMNRVQFSLPSNRPAALGWPARKRMVPSAASAMPGHEQRDPRGARLEQRRVEREADQAQRREGEEAGEPLERDGGERGLGRADVLGAATHPDDVTADGRREHVADELPGEVVGAEPADRDVDAEGADHLLPPPRREDDAERRHRQREPEPHEGPHVAVARRHLGEVDLADEERQQHRADDDPQQQPEPRPAARGVRDLGVGLLHHRVAYGLASRPPGRERRDGGPTCAS